eukprot:SAG25_NODE_14124_length_259_cov_0.518750_1_plen_51_part_10
MLVVVGGGGVRAARPAEAGGTATVGAASAIGQISEDVELIAGGDMAVTAGG